MLRRRRTDVPVLREGGHEVRLAGKGRLPEVGGLEALVRRSPLGRVVHEEEVEEAQPGRAQPGKVLLQVVVRLLLEGEVPEEGCESQTVKSIFLSFFLSKAAKKIERRTSEPAGWNTLARWRRWESPGGR